MPLSPCIQDFCVQSDLCIQCCHVSNRSVSNHSVSNWFGVQFYRVQSVRCLILLCPNSLVSNPTVSNRFGVRSWRLQSVWCPILLSPIGPTAQASVLCVQYACVQWVQSPDRIIRVNYSMLLSVGYDIGKLDKGKSQQGQNSISGLRRSCKKFVTTLDGAVCSFFIV